ncbi:MAG TPA: PRC-barrel domain-containing protein, partial [Geminicoccaceae bacterium]|nr:PRC-barrel domain-containing protein [Geminicoccaceae bacterium]
MRMLWSFNDIRGFGLRATDGEIGEVTDLLFEDATSTVRYLVVETGGWLASREVLIAPEALGEPDGAAARAFPVGLTRAQVKDSPDVGTDRPVSRQREDELRAHYGWPPYRNPPAAPVGGGLAGASPNVAYWGRAHGERIADGIGADQAGGAVTPTPAAASDGGDPHLRSAREVVGYRIEATDGEIGHVEDLLIESGSWTVRYVVVDTRNWWPGKQVPVAPEWMRRVDWSGKRVGVDLTRDMIKSAPGYTSPADIDRDFEQRLYRH